jgi:hypothetical protein
VQIKPLVPAVLAYVQADQEIRKDAGNVRRDQDNHEIVAPFRGQEALQIVSQAPDPGVCAVDLLHVAGDEVLGSLERRDEPSV